MKHWIQILLSLITLHALALTPAMADDALEIKKVTQLNGVPWGITLLDNQTAIVTIKKGQVYRVNLTNGESQEIVGVPKVDFRGQGGLLDIAKSPQFKEQPWLYFTYVKPSNKGSKTALARALLTDNKLTQWEDLIITESASPYAVHYGSRITFDDKGHVFFSVGDRGIRKNAQDLTNHAGSIIRLKLNGQVPADNPFVGHANIKNEIWSYGHRNPQGLFYDRQTQTLWSNEHGPKGGDEINLIRPAANYGWPIVSYGKEYVGSASIGEGTTKEGIDNPAKVFIPSIAPSSLLRYQGMLFSNWNGDFLSTALALRHLNKVSIEVDNETTEKRYLEHLEERLRSISEDSKGVLYIGTDSGKILKVTLAKKVSVQ